MPRRARQDHRDWPSPQCRPCASLVQPCADAGCPTLAAPVASPSPMSAPSLSTKLPKVGTTIFTVMSQLAIEHKAVNLGQGFPDFPVPSRLVEELDKAMRDGHNQY